MADNSKPAAGGKISQLSTVKAKAYTGRRNYDALLEVDESTIEDGVAYRWVSTLFPQRIARHKMLGYEFARQEHGIRTKAGITDDAADGTIRVGDSVLMICAKEYVEQRQREYAEESEAKISAHMRAEEFEARAKRAGAPVDKRISVKRSEDPN